MGLLKHLRSRSRLKSQQELGPYPNHRARELLHNLPNSILRLTFSLLAPHTLDETYEVSERSLVGSICVLCDLRDLSSCIKVCRKWQGVAQTLLYRSVRIDAVHYCPLEEILSDRRRRKHLDPLEIPATRLHLFQRTLRAVPELASQVICLKLPYTTRETCRAELSRVVSLLPNLRYVDLPEGFYRADASCQILRDSLQANCSDIRKMTFEAGSEEAFALLGCDCWWTSLETLSLLRLDVEALTLRRTLAQLPVLQRLDIFQIPRLDDSIFFSAAGLPEFPALNQLHLDLVPNITGAGIENYLSRMEVSEALNFLSLSNTAVSIASLPLIIGKATKLAHLSYLETVTKALPLEPIPPLASSSLKTLNFEIISHSTKSGVHHAQGPASTYYSYLAASLKANGLPLLRKVYVRDSNFPEQLLVTPALNADHQTESHNIEAINQPLEIYTKGDTELDWVYSAIQTPSHACLSNQNKATSNSNKEFGRPVSAYDVSNGLGPQWTGEARKSVMIGNGNGAFLAVPSEPLVIRRNQREESNVNHLNKEVGGLTVRDMRRSRGDLWR